jgi:hypothetical protein
MEALFRSREVQVTANDLAPLCTNTRAVAAPIPLHCLVARLTDAVELDGPVFEVWVA